MNELSDEQLRRQDFVDNAIFKLINELNPTAQGISWDIEMIGDVRDSIEDWLVDRKGFCTTSTFYP